MVNIWPTFGQHLVKQWSNNGQPRRRPHRYCCLRARSARPFVCGVNVGGLLCGTSIESIESTEYKICRIYRVCRVIRFYRVYRVYTVYRDYRIYSFGTCGFQKIAFFYFRKCYFCAELKLLELFSGLGTPLESSSTL